MWMLIERFFKFRRLLLFYSLETLYCNWDINLLIYCESTFNLSTFTWAPGVIDLLQNYFLVDLLSSSFIVLMVDFVSSAKRSCFFVKSLIKRSLPILGSFSSLLLIEDCPLKASDILGDVAIDLMLFYLFDLIGVTLLDSGPLS